MDKDEELTREEKDYLLSRVFYSLGYEEDFSHLTEEKEEALIDSIIGKLRDPERQPFL